MWDDCQQNRKRLLHLESVTKVNLRKDNDDIQKFSPSTPVCEKTIQTPPLPTQSFPPNQENSIYPSTPDIDLNHGDDHVVAQQIKPPSPQSEDRSLTSIKEENSLLLVQNKKQKEEIVICHQQNRSLNEELNCLSEKLRQSSAEKKDLEEKITVLQHAFSAALEENNKLKEHSWTQELFIQANQRGEKVKFLLKTFAHLQIIDSEDCWMRLLKNMYLMWKIRTFATFSLPRDL